MEKVIFHYAIQSEMNEGRKKKSSWKKPLPRTKINFVSPMHSWKMGTTTTLKLHERRRIRISETLERRLTKKNLAMPYGTHVCSLTGSYRFDRGCAYWRNIKNADENKKTKKKYGWNKSIRRPPRPIFCALPSLLSFVSSRVVAWWTFNISGCTHALMQQQQQQHPS